MAAKITNQLFLVFALAVLTVAITTSSAYDTESSDHGLVKPDLNLHLDHKTSFYVPKPRVPKVEKPVVPEVEKPVVPAEEQPAYVPATPEVEKPADVEKPNVEHGYEPEEEKEVFFPKSIGVQGLVYCQQGSKRTPIEGAVAIVKCSALDKFGDLAGDVSFLCNPTDKSGYFFTPLDLSSVVYQVSECKVFLESCPLETCSHATDINKGVSGALLGPNYNLLPHNKMNLFSVGPFIYTPETSKSTINGGY